jgi:hypothetical protein
VDIEGKFNGTIQVAEVLNVKAEYNGEVNRQTIRTGADFVFCIMKPNVKKLLLSDGKESQQKTS